jgi:hypothetical protein
MEWWIVCSHLEHEFTGRVPQLGKADAVMGVDKEKSTGLAEKGRNTPTWKISVERESVGERAVLDGHAANVPIAETLVERRREQVTQGRFLNHIIAFSAHNVEHPARPSSKGERWPRHSRINHQNHGDESKKNSAFGCTGVTIMPHMIALVFRRISSWK